MGTETRQPKLWKVADLMEYLGYETADSAIRAVREMGIPHLFLGGVARFGDRGASKLLRFVPASVEKWAAEAQAVVVVEKAGPTGSATGQGGGWKAIMPAARPTGPRRR